MKMTNLARVFQPTPLRLNFGLTSTIRYLQRLLIHEKYLLHALRAYVLPLVADCTISRSCCEIFADVMVLIWNFF